MTNEGLAVATPLSTDTPIASQAEDRLNRSSFSQNIANAIANAKADESLVIALYGAWGSGKSSVKNLVCEALGTRTESTPDILEFNPWQWRGHNDLSEAFFRDVLANLNQPNKTEQQKKTAKVIRRYAKFLGIGGVLFSGPRVIAGPLVIIAGLMLLGIPAINFAAATVLIKVIAAAALIIGAMLVWGETILEKIAVWFDARSDIGVQSLEEKKKSVAASLRQCTNSTLVIIDDIDRLTISEIRAVFQLIKANVDFPRFIYLLLFQRDIVEQALGEETKESGAKYLEKIVQVGFDLPVVRQEDIDRILFGSLDTILGVDAEKVDNNYWGNVYYGGLRQYFQNLRGVKRFLNVFNFYLGMLRHDGLLEVNPVDLIALITFSTFEPEFHRALRANKTLLTSASASSNDRNTIRQEIDALMQVASVQSRILLKEAMKTLFPGIADAFGGMRHSACPSWIRDLRICSAEMFDRYFEYSLSAKDVSQVEIARLLGLSGNAAGLTEELKRLAADGRLMTALDRWSARFQDGVVAEHITDVAD